MHIHIYIAVVFLLVAVFLLNFGAKNERENWEEDYRLKSIPVPGKWFEEYKAICYSYYPKHDRLPQSQEDCYDTSFVYTDDMNRLVKSSEKYGKYPGCLKLHNVLITVIQHQVVSMFQIMLKYSTMVHKRFKEYIFLYKHKVFFIRI